MDKHALSLLMDMCHGLGWCINCDCILSAGKFVDYGPFATYLQCASEAIEDILIDRAAVPGSVLPQLCVPFFGA
jgi:hypothetical protein